MESVGFAKDATSPNNFEVDLGAIAHNTAELRRVAGSDKSLFAAVKANAYGFGLSEVVDAVLASGADAIALVEVADGVKLRRRGVHQPILVYAGSLAVETVISAVDRYRLMPTLVDWDSASAYSSLASRPIKAFIKVDVGLERNGIPSEMAVDLVKAVRALPNIEVEGIYTHLHGPARSESSAYVEWQYQRFVDVLRGLQAADIDIPIQMAASSGLIGLNRDMTLNAIDPGHALYGLSESGRENSRLQLRPAFGAVKSRLTHVKAFQRTEFVAELPFNATGVTRIGVIPFGEAHGMVTLNSGHVLIHGRRVRILGAPHVEHTRLDLTDVPDAVVGDEVIVIGTQGNTEISRREVMSYQGMGREVALALQVRDSVARQYRRQ